MTTMSQRTTRIAGTIAVASALALGLAGCPGNTNMDATPEGGGDAGDVVVRPDATDAVDVPGDTPADVPGDVSTTPTMATMVVACGTICEHPLDAVPNSDGSTIYFTAFNTDGIATVFSVPGGGGTITPLAVGGGLEFPVGIAISPDDHTLYIADESARRGAAGPVGAVFSLAAMGGTPAMINVGTDLIRPAALTVSSDGMTLTISALRASDEHPSVFTVPTAGGTATAVASDLADPSGVSIAPSGTTIVHDTIRIGSHNASAVVVMGSGTMPQTSGLRAGYPAGLAFNTDGSGVLLAGSLGGTGGRLTWAPMGGGSPSNPAALSADMVQPLGLHRARTANAWSVADDEAMGNGAIFVVR